MLAVAVVLIGAVAGESGQVSLGGDMYVDGIVVGTLHGECIVAVIVVLGLAYPFIFQIHLSALENFAKEMSAEIFYIHAYAPVRYVHNYIKNGNYCQWDILSNFAE